MGTSSVTLPSQPPRTGQCYEDTHYSEIFALIVRLRGKDILQEVDSSLSSPHILMPAAGYIYLGVLDGGGGWRVSGAGIQSVSCPDTGRIQRSVLGPTLLQHSLIRPSHLQPHSAHTAAATARILHYSHLWGCSWITSVEACPGFISNTIIRYSYMTNDEDVVYSQSLRLMAGNYN